MDVHGIFTDKLQKSVRIRLPLLRIENRVLRGRYPQAGKNFKLIGAVRQNQHTRGILVKELLILIQIQIAEHFAVFHVVSIEQGILVVKGIVTAGIQKNASGQGKLPVHVRIDIAEIILSLHNRIIDPGIIQRQPGADIRIDGKQFLKGRPVLFRRRSAR